MSASDDKKSASESESFAISDAYVPTSRETLSVDKSDRVLAKTNRKEWSVAIQTWSAVLGLCSLLSKPFWFAIQYDSVTFLVVPLVILAISTAMIVRGTWKCYSLFFFRNRPESAMPIILGVCGTVIAWIALYFAILTVYHYSPFGDFGGSRSSGL